MIFSGMLSLAKSCGADRNDLGPITENMRGILWSGDGGRSPTYDESASWSRLLHKYILVIY
jgi:hypothetical protein